MSAATTPTSISSTEVRRDEWFDDIVATLRGHQCQLETNTATQEISGVYKTLIGGNIDEIITLNQKNAQLYFITNMVFDYSKLLENIEVNQLGFDYSTNVVLVWVEIADDNEVAEDALIMAQAKINANYYAKNGFYLDTTIVEDCDGFEMPANYKPFIQEQKT